MNRYLRNSLIALCLLLTAVSIVGALFLYSSIRHEKLVAENVAVDKKELLAGELFQLNFTVDIPFELRKDDVAISLEYEDLIYLKQTLKLEEDSLGLHAIERRYSLSIQSLKDEGAFQPSMTALIADKSFKITLPEMKVKGFVEFKEDLNKAQLVLTEEEIKPVQIPEKIEEPVSWTTILAVALLLIALALFIVPRLKKEKQLDRVIDEELEALLKDKSLENRLAKSVDKLFDYMNWAYSLKVSSQTTVEALPSLEKSLNKRQLDELNDLLRRSDELKFEPFSEENEDVLVEKVYEFFKDLRKTGGTPVLPGGGER